jgi:hypothetical protein
VQLPVLSIAVPRFVEKEETDPIHSESTPVAAAKPAKKSNALAVEFEGT